MFVAEEHSKARKGREEKKVHWMRNVQHQYLTLITGRKHQTNKTPLTLDVIKMMLLVPPVSANLCESVADGLDLCLTPGIWCTMAVNVDDEEFLVCVRRWELNEGHLAQEIRGYELSACSSPPGNPTTRRLSVRFFTTSRWVPGLSV